MAKIADAGLKHLIAVNLLDAVVLSANAATQWVLGTDPRTVEGRPWSSVREEHLPTLDDGLLQAAP